jgi:integrase/recombinase XerD
LRPRDIRQLTLDEIDWREARIDLRQVKTGRPLALPLLPDVAGALSAYLLDGRPASTSRTVFLRHSAPFEPFAAENNLATTCTASCPVAESPWTVAVGWLAVQASFYP